MFKIKTLNKISNVGLDTFSPEKYIVGGDAEEPDGILLRSADMHSYELNDDLLCIARAGTGVNNIPVEKCTQKGIPVFNTPGANSDSVKELALCALLISSRDIIGGVDWVRGISGEGDRIPEMVEKGKSEFIGPEIMGKALGVIGLGAVGAKIADAAQYLGMRVYGYDPFLSVDAAWRLSKDVVHATDIDAIYRNCDYITLHVPYIPETHHMINAGTIEKMKNGVRLINLARGELVDDKAITAGLDSGKIEKYVTDFPSDATAGMANVIPFPHLGASTPESEEKCAFMAARATQDYLENGNVTNSINFPDVSLDRMGVCRLCVFHKNVPRVINRILDLVGEQNINVEHMINKPRGEYAYTIIDTGSPLDEEMRRKIFEMDEILRARIIL